MLLNHHHQALHFAFGLAPHLTTVPVIHHHHHHHHRQHSPLFAHSLPTPEAHSEEEEGEELPSSLSWRRRFSDFLRDRVTVDGHFYAHGTEPNVALSDLPALSVIMGKDKDDDDDDDLDLTIRIGFPFSKSQAQQIIRSGVAVPSPFGVGNQTRVDASVRKSWQLEPHQVSFGGDDANGCGWETKLNSIVEQACQALGVTTQQQQQQQQNDIVVCAKLHKVLLYKEGGFFQPHVDSEKETGMFGTLAIQLPSCFQGGAMVFEHHASGIKERVPLAPPHSSSPPESSLMWLAWYADCLHEVTPVTFGHRLVLVYNLILTTTAADATATAAGVDEDEKADPAKENDETTTTTTTPKTVPLPYTVSPSDVSDLQCLVDEWKQRIQQRLLDDDDKDNVMPQRDDLKWLEKDFVNDICFVHRLDHRYTLPGWSACDFYNELFYGFDSTIDKFHTIDDDDDDGNATKSDKAGEQLMRGVQSLKGRDRNLVELLSKANGLEMTLVLQDFRDLSNFEEDMQLVVTKQVNGQDLPLWNTVPTTIDLVDNHDDTNNERTTRTTTNDNDNFRLVHFDSPLTGVYQQPKDTFYRLPPCTFFSWDTLFQGEQQFRALNVPSIEYIGNEGQFGESLYRMAFLIIRPKLGTKPAFGII